MFFVFLLFCLSLASPVISWSAPAPHFRSLNFLGGGGSSSSLGVGSASAGNGGASATGIGASSGSGGYSNALGLGSASNNYRGSSATGLGYGSSGYGGSNAIGIGSANSAGRSGSSLGIGSAQSSPWGSSATGIGSASSGYGLRGRGGNSIGIGSAQSSPWGSSATGIGSSNSRNRLRSLNQNPSSSSALGVGFSQDIEGGPSVGLGFGNANSFGGDGGQASGSGFSASIDPGIGGYNNGKSLYRARHLGPSEMAKNEAKKMEMMEMQSVGKADSYEVPMGGGDTSSSSGSGAFAITTAETNLDEIPTSAYGDNYVLSANADAQAMAESRRRQNGIYSSTYLDQLEYSRSRSKSKSSSCRSKYKYPKRPPCYPGCPEYDGGSAMGRDQTMFDSGSSRDDYMMQKKRTCPCYSDKSLNGHYLLRGGKKKPHFRKMRSLDYEDYVPRPYIR